MAKNSFINKKALLSILIVFAIIGAGIGLYFLFSPKVDMNAPYNNFYDYKTDESINEVISYNTNIYQYIVTCEDREQDEAFKNSIGERGKIIEQVLKIYNLYSTIDTKMLDNLIFTKNNDGKMLKYQRNMTNSFIDLKKSANDCKNYIDTYLDCYTIDIDNKSNKTVIDLIDNYNNLYYFNFLNSLTNFYVNASVIYQNYLTNTFSTNRYSGFVINMSCLWQQKLVSNLSEKDCNISNIQTSLTNLTNFLSSALNTSKTYFNSQESFDNILNNFTKIDTKICVESLANNTYTAWANSQESEELKSSAHTLLKDFFLVEG